MTDSLVNLGQHNVEREVGITYRRLDHWTRIGLLKPLHGGGSGNSRYWTRSELNVARIMGRLTAAGLSLEAAHEVARSGKPRTEIAPGIWIEVAA